MLHVAVLGAGGRMGQTLLEAIATHTQLTLSGALVRPGSELVGQTAAASIRYTDQPVGALDKADVAIDFSLSEAFNSNLKSCLAADVPMVIGTTGLSAAQQQRLREISHDIAVLWSPNMSVGVNLCFRMAEMAARVLGLDYDAEIIDIHHRHKRDAPSGTALQFGELIAAARGQQLQKVSEFRAADQDRARHRGAIGFSAVRAGEIVGEHSVMFAAAGETVEIRHRAGARSAFADGALRAAIWLAHRPPGHYAMTDVLGI